MKKIALLIYIFTLAGCASTPLPVGGENCVEASLHAGIERCVAWQFGPTQYQRQNFGKAPKFRRGYPR